MFTFSGFKWKRSKIGSKHPFKTATGPAQPVQHGAAAPPAAGQQDLAPGGPGLLQEGREYL